MRKSALFALLVSLFVNSADASEFPSSWHFVTLRSAHFDVIVNAGQQELGRLYANKLEHARTRLQMMFTDVPERTVVVIADKTDLTNGYATRLPYPHIFIYPVLPGPQESVGEGGDWALELAAHEFTHILTFEAVSGVMEPLQSVFGTILSPNLLLPSWWKEGVAVQIETALSNGGRLRSAYQDGIVRTLESDRRLEAYTLPQINEPLPDWPLGMRPYLFGSLFWSEAVAQKGPEVIDHLHQQHGGRVPYFVEKPAYREFGKNYEGQYIDAIHETRRRVRAQISALSAVPFSQIEKLKLDALTSQGPAISPDGNLLALVALNDEGQRSVRVVSRGVDQTTFVDAVEIEEFTDRQEVEVQPDVRDGPPTGSISRVSWLPDGKSLVFDKTDAVSRRETWSDLWVFNVETGKTDRLTTGLRAREPFAARDGSIYFTGLSGGDTWLGSFDPASKQTRRLWSGPAQSRIGFPAQMDDGRIAFSLRDSRGERLMAVPAAGGDAAEMLTDFPNARFPLAANGGLYFSSSRNGVHNLYFSRDLKTAVPVTHALGGAFAGARDPRNGDLYVGMMTSDGGFVHRVPQTETARVENTALPAVRRLFADRYPEREPPQVPETPVEAEDYRALPYLSPRYWFPMVGLSAVNNSLTVQAQTSSFDPLKKHSYSLMAAWDSGVKRASYDVSYVNGISDHAVALNATRTTSYLITMDNPVITDRGSVSILPDIFRLNRYTSATMAWSWLRTDYDDSAAERSGPSLLLRYADYRRGGEQISPEEGGSAMLGVFKYLPGGTRLDYTQYLAAGSYYFDHFLPKLHAIALRFSSAYTPDTVASVYGVQTTNYFFLADAPGPDFVMRGYRVGHFFGKTLTNAGAEYRFPLREIRRGHGTDPIFITRLHGAFFVDAVGVDGFAYRDSTRLFERVPASKIFASAGAEARLETTIGYFLPVNFIAGIAVPSEKDYSQTSLLLSLQAGTLF